MPVSSASSDEQDGRLLKERATAMHERKYPTFHMISAYATKGRAGTPTITRGMRHVARQAPWAAHPPLFACIAAYFVSVRCSLQLQGGGDTCTTTLASASSPAKAWRLPSSRAKTERDEEACALWSAWTCAWCARALAGRPLARTQMTDHSVSSCRPPTRTRGALTSWCAFLFSDRRNHMFDCSLA